MMTCVLLTALLSGEMGAAQSCPFERFTPTDMYRPSVHSLPASDFDTSGSGYLPRSFGFSDRWNKPTFCGTVSLL